MAGTVDTGEGKVAVRLDLTNLLTNVLVVDDLERLKLLGGKVLLAGPLKGVGPGLVTEPVADEVSITGVDQNGDLLEDTGHKAVVRLEPISVEQEVTVDVKVARVVTIDLGTNGIAHTLLAKVLADPAHALVAEVARVLALAANVVDVLTGALVGANHGVVTVNRGGDADPRALAVVARLNHALAAVQRVVHGLASALVNNSGVATITAGHGAVVLVLGKAISETVTDQNGLQVDVALLVGQNLRSHDRDIVTSVGLASNVEVLLGVLGELLEEQGKESVDILASSNGVTDGGTAVGVADVDGLVEEDNRGIVVPRVVVVDGLDVLADGARTKFQKQSSEGGAARATVQPQDNGVVLGVVARLEEPLYGISSCIM